VQAFYSRIPTEEELRGTGFTPADYEQEDFEVWPENERAIRLFLAIKTQWRTGVNGPTGLDYNVLFSAMDRMKLSDQDYESMFLDMRVIESAALVEIQKKD
jgi:hypothetical protein